MSQTVQAAVPDTHKDLLERPAFAHMATLGPKGEPHTSPVWYDWDGEYLLVSHTTGRQKFRNVKRDDRVALSILDPENAYRYLEVRGRVEAIEPDPEKTLIHKLAKKYMGADRYEFDGPQDERVIFKIRATRVSTG